MKLLKIITHPDYPIPNEKTEKHEAVRVILVDSRDMILLIHSAEMGIYKIPGGKMVVGEDISVATKRESSQELGCETEILDEIGEIREERPADTESGRGNIVQSSYCSYGRILSEGDLQMSEKKQKRGFEFVWLAKSETLEKMKSSQPKTQKAELVKKRDIIIFEEYYNSIRK